MIGAETRVSSDTVPPSNKEAPFTSNLTVSKFSSLLVSILNTFPKASKPPAKRDKSPNDSEKTN